MNKEEEKLTERQQQTRKQLPKLILRKQDTELLQGKNCLKEIHLTSQENYNV